MRKLFSVTVLAFLLIGCDSSQPSQNTQNTNAATKTPPTVTQETALASSQPQCYELKNADERVLIHLTEKEDKRVEGDYLWEPAESDGSYGTLKGTIKEGLIYVDHTFSQGEGYPDLVEEMVFKHNNNTLIQGTGEATTQNGKFVLPDVSKLEWTRAYSTIDCAKLQANEPAASGATQQNGGEIHFSKGASSATLEGAAVRGTLNEYQLMAGAGQWVEVKISSVENNAVFQLSVFQYGTGEDVQFEGAKDGQDAQYWYGQLPNPGYSKDGKQNPLTIVVGGTRGNATYTLTVTIQDKAWK